jgi:hypothetical protein
MSFNIIYVENVDKHYQRVCDAVDAYNKTGCGEQLFLERAATPEELQGKLHLRFDLMITDVYFDDPITGERDLIPRLDNILEIVNTWKAGPDGGIPLPIIAYTGKGSKAFELILEHKERLYDIWDKNTASPEYITWRLSRLTSEVSKLWPDALLQRLIRGMSHGASWHLLVKDMISRYEKGKTERDQLVLTGKAIIDIARNLGLTEQCRTMWKVMIDWEALSMAAFRSTRGHARHVINVFWLGYYLMHHSALKQWFIESWNRLVAARSGMGQVANFDPMEALSAIWYFTSIFHDVGGCVERAALLQDEMGKLLEGFKELAPDMGKMVFKKKVDLVAETGELFDKGDPLFPLAETEFRKRLDKGQPDEGMVAALHLKRISLENATGAYLREAARAICIHNIIGTIGDGTSILPIEWNSDPILCLLLFCDQLQSWHRERHDSTLWDDAPYRAELISLDIRTGGGAPQIEMSIDYVAPAHVKHARDIYSRVRDDLETVLQTFPEKALKRIKTTWPFQADISCFLSGDLLGTRMKFGIWE